MGARAIDNSATANDSVSAGRKANDRNELHFWAEGAKRHAGRGLFACPASNGKRY